MGINIQIWIATKLLRDKLAITPMVGRNKKYLLYFFEYKNDSEQLAYFLSNKR